MSLRVVSLGLTLALTGCAARAPVWHAASPDLAVRVTVQERGAQSCVQVGANAPSCHDAVSLPGMTLSGRGGSVAYPAKVGSRWVVIHDGRAGPQWDGVGAPVLSLDGKRVAYAAVAASGWSVVVDGKPGATFDAIIANTLTFDSTGTHVGYVGRRGDASIVVVDGREGRAFTFASRPVFSANGAHVGSSRVDLQACKLEYSIVSPK